VEPRTTTGQLSSIVVYLQGGSVSAIQTAGQMGSRLEAFAEAIAGTGAARTGNEAVGRRTSSDFNVRRNTPAEVMRQPSGREAAPQKPPEAPVIRESKNAALSAFGESPRTYTDPFTGQTSPITSSREKGSAANSADRATSR
jgi:hypothetical protein